MTEPDLAEESEDRTMNIDERIAFMLRFLSSPSADVETDDYVWVQRFFEQFERTGKLSDRQLEVLEDIYAKY